MPKTEWWLGKPQSAPGKHQRKAQSSEQQPPCVTRPGGCEVETALRALRAGHVTWTRLHRSVRTKLISAGIDSGLHDLRCRAA